MRVYRKALPYFTKKELACQGTGVIALDIRFAIALPALRHAWGKPLTPTSVCRHPVHNSQIGGHPRSLHLTDNPEWPTYGCMAADIAWGHWSGAEWRQFCALAWDTGWSIGLSKTFVHIDRRADIGMDRLPQTVYTYDDWPDDFGKAEITGG